VHWGTNRVSRASRFAAQETERAGCKLAGVGAVQVHGVLPLLAALLARCGVRACRDGLVHGVFPGDPPDAAVAEPGPGRRPRIGVWGSANRARRVWGWVLGGLAGRPARAGAVRRQRDGRHRSIAGCGAGANWCMGFWRRLKPRAPGRADGSGAWASGLRAALRTLAVACGTRGSKQEIWNHGCTQMHTDGTVPTASARLPGFGCRDPAVNEPAGLRPIRVHLCASVVPNFLLGRVPHGSARKRHGMAPCRGATCLTVHGVFPCRRGWHAVAHRRRIGAWGFAAARVAAGARRRRLGRLFWCMGLFQRIPVHGRFGGVRRVVVAVAGLERCQGRRWHFRLRYRCMGSLGSEPEGKPGWRVATGRPFGRVRRAAKQARKVQRRCRQMHAKHADGTCATASARLPKCGCAISAVKDHGGPRPICVLRVHLPASALNPFWLCRAPRWSAREGHGVARHQAVARCASRCMGCFRRGSGWCAAAVLPANRCMGFCRRCSGLPSGPSCRAAAAANASPWPLPWCMRS